MRRLGYLISYVAVLLNGVGAVFERAAFVLNGLLPAMLPPRDLSNLIRIHYDRTYTDAYARFSNELYEWSFESWEEEVLDRHGVRSGEVLVLGAGVGRESVALAKRGLRVIGLDINREALQTGARIAERSGVHPSFVQADFLHLPIKAACCDYILFSGIMYSAIPGRRHRQAWLTSLRGPLKQDGMIVLNFLVDRWPPTRSRRLVDRLNRLAASLPGGNKAYQEGDTCAQSHFLHAFQNESEFRQELDEAGVTMVEVNWPRGYAVVKLPAAETSHPR